MLIRNTTINEQDLNYYINKPFTHLVLLHVHLLPTKSCRNSSGIVPGRHKVGSFWHKSSQIGAGGKSIFWSQVQFCVQLLRIYVSPTAYSISPSTHGDCTKEIDKKYELNGYTSKYAQKMKFPKAAFFASSSKFSASCGFAKKS